jgi:hypothetical protein
MARKQRRYLGQLDAAMDEHFKEHFIESLHLQRLLTDQSDIVYGSKGVGKTALRRALTEIHQSSYYATKTIDLNQISFSQLHAALSHLKDTTQTEVPTLARNTWRNVLAIYFLEAVADQLPETDVLKTTVDNIIDTEGFKGRDSHDRLLSQIERFLLRIAAFGVEDDAPTPLGLSIRQISVVNVFPSNPAIEPLLTQVANLVINSGKTVLICIDGFDSIVDHTPDSRKAIFAGLIDAIHKFSRDELLAKALSFKAFLPQELTDGADAIVWDADKHVMNARYLRWGESDFQAFLLKRLHTFTKTKSLRFFDVWNECMPDKIRNEAHGIEEITFNYILRHTLFRPRQIMIHMQKIIDAWDERSDVARVDPTFVPQIVALTNRVLARTVINQLEIKYSGLSTFMQSMHNCENTMAVGEFQEKINKVFCCDNPQTLNNVFNDFFNFGIFGTAVNKTISRGAQQSQFRFGYVGDMFETRVYAKVDPTDIVALSPMFHEYCECKISNYGAIIPV